MIKFLRKANKKNLGGIALLRLDFNTKDDWRINASAPTIKFLLKYADKVVILSHRGRPKRVKIIKNKPVGFDKKLSLKIDALYLKKLLNKDVVFIPHFDFKKIREEVFKSKKTIFVIENLRFLEGEAKNSATLARKLASMGDYYVNDAFAVSHRENSSVCAITRYIQSYAGLELEKEIKFLSKIMRMPKKPLVVIIGGAKVKDKLGIIKYFKDKADRFLIGGGAANSLLPLMGVDVGTSLRDKDIKNKQLIKKLINSGKIVLPVDWEKKNSAILDIGVKTIRIFSNEIKKARSIIWSGPLGYIENRKYELGTLYTAKAIAKNLKSFSVVGGGETVSFIKKYNLDKKMGFISTGGGAMISYLSKKKMPGIEALKKHF